MDKVHNEYLKVFFNQGEKYLYFYDKYTYEKEKKFYKIHNIHFEERKMRT